MQYDTNNVHRAYIQTCCDIARRSTCLRSKCGSIVVLNNQIIGKGWNSPPHNTTPLTCQKDVLPSSFKSDKTCCVHAEQRALFDAVYYLGLHHISLATLAEATIYFARLDAEDHLIPSGHPYCTICSKLCADLGIGFFALHHDATVHGLEGIYIYPVDEYNTISFQYRDDRVQPKNRNGINE